MGPLRYERTVSPETRARLGIYYTPEALADRLAWAALATWAETAVGLPFEDAWALFATGHARARDAEAVRRSLRDATLLDPACGTGALLHAARRSLRSALGADVPVTLKGTDLDPAAIALARAHAVEIDFSVGDALEPPDVRAQIVLANPPFGAKVRGGDIDRYVAFWRAAAARTAEGGVLAILSPTSWRTGARYERARRDVILPSGVFRIMDVPRGAFPEAYVDTCISLCRPGRGAAKPVTARVSLTSNGAPEWTPGWDVASAATPAFGPLGGLFESSRGILAPKVTTEEGDRLLVGDVAPFAWPRDRRSFVRVRDADVLEGRAALTMRAGRRLLVRRIVGRASRLTCIVPAEDAIVKKDFYVFVPRDRSLCLEAYAALLHTRPIALALGATDIASTKNDFAQLTLGALRDLSVPRLASPERPECVRAAHLPGEAVDVGDLELASAWLSARAIEGAAIGAAVLRGRAGRVDADPRWRPLRGRLDAFVSRLYERWSR